MNSGSIVYIIFLVIIMGVAVGISIKGMSEGRDGDDYEHICIHGHSYWTATFGMKGMTTINLDADGKPIPCFVEVK